MTQQKKYFILSEIITNIIQIIRQGSSMRQQLFGLYCDIDFLFLIFKILIPFMFLLLLKLYCDILQTLKHLN